MRIDSIKIKLLLAERGMTQSAFADLCGISRQNVSITLSRGTCSPAKVAKMAQALRISAQDIIKKEA